MLPVFGGMGVGGNMGSNIGGSMPGSQPHPSSLMPNQFPMPQIPGGAGVVPNMQPFFSKPPATSPAQYLLKPQQQPKVEEMKKVFVGKIPKGVSDEFMERILKVCGKVISWKRQTDSKGVPKTFGICEYEEPESLLKCLTIMNGITLLESQLLIKVDKKTEDFLQDWQELKKEDWIEKERKKGKTVDIEDLENREKMGEPMEWKQSLIGDTAIIFSQIEEIVQNRDIIDAVSSQAEDHLTSISRDLENRYKEHNREKDREKRRRFREREREKQYEKLLKDWLERERMREKGREREREKELYKAKNVHKLILSDLNYDHSIHKNKIKREGERYLRFLDERKKFRDREREEDEMERRKEEELKALEELKEIEREEEERKRREDLQKNTHNFVLVDTEKKNKREESASNSDSESKSSNSEEDKEIDMFAQQEEQLGFGLSQPVKQNKAAFTMGDADDSSLYESKHKPLTKLDSAIHDKIKDIETETINKFKEEEQREKKAQLMLKNFNKDQDTKKQFLAIKDIYEQIPKYKYDLFKYPINWQIVNKNNILEKKLKPWVGKKLKEYLGVEEQNLIDLIVRKVEKKCPPQEILDKCETFLEEIAEEFVVKMWKIIIFEILKVENNITE